MDNENKANEDSTMRNNDYIKSKEEAQIVNPAVAKDDETFLNSLPPSQQFLLLAVAMMFFFGIHNVLQEAIMKFPDFKYGIMLGYMEVLGVTICSFVERRYITKETGHVAPLSYYPYLTACLMASSALSNMSLNYINFPTKVVFRSCKLLPTMVISTIMNRRVFSSNQYVCAIAISTGLVMFAAADWKLTPTFNSLGLTLVSLSVIADAILPNAQEKLFNMGSSRLEVTFYTNFFTLIGLTISTIASGDLIAVLKLSTSNSQLACYLAFYTAISYVAISSFMLIVKEFGGVAAVVLGTARKAMSIILSFIVFPKPFSWLYVAGAGFVLGGLLTVSLTKHIEKKKSTIESNNQEDGNRRF